MSHHSSITPEGESRPHSRSLSVSSQSNNNLPLQHSESPYRRASVKNTNQFLLTSNFPFFINENKNINIEKVDSETTCSDTTPSNVHTRPPSSESTIRDRADSMRHVPLVADIYNKLKSSIVERRNSLIGGVSNPCSRRNSYKIAPLLLQDVDDQKNSATVDNIPDFSTKNTSENGCLHEE